MKLPIIIRLTHFLENFINKTKTAYWFATQYYKNIVKREIALADITSSDNILFIGGGICPMSAILLHQATNAKITVIDNDSECIPKAQEIIKQLGMSNSIQVLHQDGKTPTLPLHDFTVVQFAMQVTPMWDVFSQVEKQVTPGTKLLIRKPKKTFCNLYSRLLHISCDNCHSVNHNRTSNVGSTILYVKPAF